MYILSQKFLFVPQIWIFFQNFPKTLTYVLGGILIGMCAKFQVDTFKNNVFIAFETSKMAGVVWGNLSLVFVLLSHQNAK